MILSNYFHDNDHLIKLNTILHPRAKPSLVLMINDLMVRVLAFLQLIYLVLSSSHRSSLISCVRFARRRWQRAKTKTVQAERRRRSVAASFNAKVPKKDMVNLSGLRTDPHRRSSNPPHIYATDSC